MRRQQQHEFEGVHDDLVRKESVELVKEVVQRLQVVGRDCLSFEIKAANPSVLAHISSRLKDIRWIDSGFYSSSFQYL